MTFLVWEGGMSCPFRWGRGGGGGGGEGGELNRCINICQFHMGLSAAKPPYRPHPNSSLCLHRLMILR